jgi:hypothetical protein
VEIVNLSPVEKEIAEPNETFVRLTRTNLWKPLWKPAQAGLVCVAAVSTAPCCAITGTID